ncbi:MAG TPA: hypothetical protein VFK92_02645 [Burkholderiales bacterium]|nr:hypothetical protein [Burkholderiales bacterium]
MIPATERSLYWLAGPAVAAVLVAFAVGLNVLAGLFLLCMVGAAAFLLGIPLIQLLLLATPKFRGRYAAACGTSMALTTIALIALTFTGRFNFT